MEPPARFKQYSMYQPLSSLSSFLASNLFVAANVVVRLGAFIQKLLDTQPHVKSLHQDSDADAWHNCFAQLRHRWMKSGAVFEAKNEDKKLKQLVGQQNLNFAISPMPFFWYGFREAARLQFTKHAVNTAGNTSTRRFSSLLYYVPQIWDRTRGPKNGATKRTQKWSQQVDPKMAPPLMNVFIATPFLGPRFDPTFCCDPAFEHNFEATEAAQHKQNLYGWIRLKAKQTVRKHVCPWKRFGQAHAIQERQI